MQPTEKTMRAISAAILMLAVLLNTSAAFADKYAWAERVEQCLKEKNVLIKDDGKRGCYVTENFKVYCSRAIAEECSAKANDAVRPARYERRGMRPERSESPRRLERPSSDRDDD
jgi:hypothetical protein